MNLEVQISWQAQHSVNCELRSADFDARPALCEPRSANFRGKYNFVSLRVQIRGRRNTL